MPGRRRGGNGCLDPIAGGSGAVAQDDVEAEIDAGRGGAAGEAVEDEGGGAAAHLAAGDADGGEGRMAFARDLEIAEAGDGEAPRDGDAAARAGLRAARLPGRSRGSRGGNLARKDGLKPQARFPDCWGTTELVQMWQVKGYRQIRRRDLVCPLVGGSVQ